MSPNQPEKDGRPNCMGCLHFYITHKKDRPYGCRAMGFISLQMPSIAVKMNSGMDCQLFSRKKPKTT